jgi:hypothetical protein
MGVMAFRAAYAGGDRLHMQTTSPDAIGKPKDTQAGLVFQAKRRPAWGMQIVEIRNADCPLIGSQIGQSTIENPRFPIP